MSLETGYIIDVFDHSGKCVHEFEDRTLEQVFAILNLYRDAGAINVYRHNRLSLILYYNPEGFEL